MDSGNVAWILASAALVCMMIPALALFYGGMVGSRRILNMMMMCFGGASLVAVLWALFGYSLAFGNSVGGLGLIGDITEFPGKVRLIAVGFGEAATAVNNAAVAIDPSAHLFPGHSSEA